MNKLIKLGLIYLTVFILFSVVYLVLFHSPFFNSQTVLFYRGILLLISTTLVFLLAVVFVYFKSPKVNIESLIASVIISAAIHLSFFVVFPVTFERSITMYFLSSLQKNSSAPVCPGLTKEQAEKLLINDYIIKNKAVDKRIQEQKIINFINVKNNCIQATPRAIEFLNFSVFVKKLYNIDK